MREDPELGESSGSEQLQYTRIGCDARWPKLGEKVLCIYMKQSVSCCIILRTTCFAFNRRCRHQMSVSEVE